FNADDGDPVLSRRVEEDPAVARAKVDQDVTRLDAGVLQHLLDGAGAGGTVGSSHHRRQDDGAYNHQRKSKPKEAHRTPRFTSVPRCFSQGPLHSCRDGKIPRGNRAGAPAARKSLLAERIERWELSPRKGRTRCTRV